MSFDLIVRRLRAIDAPEQGLWRADARWAAPMALAFVIAQSTGHIVTARAVVGPGEPDAADEAGGEALGRWASLEREVERYRAAKTVAISLALADLSFRSPYSPVQVTGAFNLRAARAHFSGEGEGISRFARLERMPASFDRAAPAAGLLPAASNALRSVRAADAVARDLSGWLERRYAHDEWQPEDTGLGEISAALDMLSANHNHELSELPRKPISIGLLMPRHLSSQTPFPRVGPELNAATG